MNSIIIALSLLLGAFACGVFGADNVTEPPVQRYAVRNPSNNTFCILLEAGIRLHFNYSTGDKKNVTYDLDVPKNTNHTTGGTCGNLTQTLQLTLNNSTVLTFVFNKTGEKQKNVALVSVMFNFTASLLPYSLDNTTYRAELKNVSKFECQAGNGYHCNSNSSLTFSDATPLVRIETIDLKVEAFRTTNETTFSNKFRQCDADYKISNIIPIAVGAALGALVLIVLIAYLVGRKRSQRGGYETV